MYDLHDRVTFSKDGKNIVGKIVNVYYNLEKEVMVTLESDNQKHYIVKMSDLNSCKTCRHSRLHGYQKPCKECHDHSHWSEVKAVSFQRLNGLKPTTESCTMKVLEEVGELMQLIGKGQGKSGESGQVVDLIWAVRAVEESFDTAQSAMTMAYTLCDEYGINIDEIIDKHETKLREKGYLI